MLFLLTDIIEKDPDSECKRLAAQTMVLMQSSVQKVWKWNRKQWGAPHGHSKRIGCGLPESTSTNFFSAVWMKQIYSAVCIKQIYSVVCVKRVSDSCDRELMRVVTCKANLIYVHLTCTLLAVFKCGTGLQRSGSVFFVGYPNMWCTTTKYGTSSLLSRLGIKFCIWRHHLQ